MGRRSHTRTLKLWMNGEFVGAWSSLSNAAESLQYDLTAGRMDFEGNPEVAQHHADGRVTKTTGEKFSVTVNEGNYRLKIK